MRGYFEIGIFHPKTPANLGTLWRSAYQLGASGIFVIGHRFRRQTSDTTKTWRHVPLREYEDFDHFLSCRPYDCELIGIEMGGKLLSKSHHPERATYLLGAEDHGLPPAVIDKCQKVISLDAINTESYNVAVAGSLIMYHRQFITD
jgi:tRNA G18 (ribose-2'-O)-methylase SpoU